MAIALLRSTQSTVIGELVSCSAWGSPVWSGFSQGVSAGSPNKEPLKHGVRQYEHEAPKTPAAVRNRTRPCPGLRCVVCKSYSTERLAAARRRERQADPLHQEERPRGNAANGGRRLRPTLLVRWKHAFDGRDRMDNV